MQKNPRMLRKKKSLYQAFSEFFLKSIILHAFYDFTSSIYKKISQSLFCACVTSYEKVVSWLSNSVIVNFLKPKFKDDPQNTLAYKIASKYETSVFAFLIDKLKWTLITSQLNILATFGITFGLSSSLAIILKNFALKFQRITTEGLLDIINPLMTSLCFIVISILLIFSKKPLIKVINESRFVGYILFNVLRMRKIPASHYEKYTGLTGGVSALLGILFGTFSFWIEPSKSAVVLGIVLAFSLIMHSPEAGVTGMFFLVPFISTKALIFYVCSVVLSYFIKCCRRKRLFKFEAIDILVVAFSIFIVSGGVISVDMMSSIPKTAVYICFISMYFITKNIVRTENLLESCAKSLSASALVVSVIGISQYFLGQMSQKWQDIEMFANIPGRVVSTFENPNVLGEYLIIILPIVFAMLLTAKGVGRKFWFFSVFIFCSCCLIFTWSRGAWLGFSFAVIAFIVLKSHEFFAKTLLLSPVIILGLTFILNQNIIDRILSIGNTADSSTMYRLNIWRGVFDMLEDKFLYGIGIGTEAFSAVFPRYAFSGTETAPHTHSLYLQITTEMGIFALISFLFILLAFLGIVFSHMHHTSQKSSRTLSLGCLCGISAFCIQGLTDYVWYNYKIYLFFWMMLGFSISLIYICSENERKRFLYA